MPKVGSFSYPKHTIEDAYEILEKIKKRGDSVSNQSVVADKLGHNSPDSGSFRMKLSSLRQYGLISSRGAVELTDLGESILYPDPPEEKNRRKNLGKAVKNVELLAQLYRKLEYQSPPNNFWHSIAEVTDVSNGEAQDKEEDIRKLYESGLKYIKALEQSSKEDEQKDKNTEEQRHDGDGTLPEGVEMRVIMDGSKIDVQDKTSLKMAEVAFDEAKKKFDVEDE